MPVGGTSREDTLFVKGSRGNESGLQGTGVTHCIPEVSFSDPLGAPISETDAGSDTWRQQLTVLASRIPLMPSGEGQFCGTDAAVLKPGEGARDCRLPHRGPAPGRVLFSIT